GGFQAVPDRDEALGERFDAELAGLGHVILSAATHVFGFGMGAQQLVLLAGDGGLGSLELGAQRRHFSLQRFDSYGLGRGRPAGLRGLIHRLLGCRHWEFLQKTIASAPIMGADLLVSRGDGPENSGFAGLAGRRWVACRKSLLQRLVYGGLGFALRGIVG